MMYQWSFKITGLIPHQAKLKRKIWLKKDELLLKQNGNDLIAYLLGAEEDSFTNAEKVLPYLWMTCLVSHNSPDLIQKGGRSILSKGDLGTGNPLSLGSAVSISYPDEAIQDIENYAHRFIKFVGGVHDNYIEVVENNAFIKIALEYFYDAQKKFVYNDEGFISAMISLESLFNEGPSDIKYKLSHRAGFILGLSGADSVQVFEKLKALYNMRSKLVHGGGTPPYDPDRGHISTYTRQAIIIFLILLHNKKRSSIGKKRRKESLLKEIDYAMLDTKKRALLQKEIKKGLKYFRLQIPRTFDGEGKNGGYRVTAW